MVSNFNNPCQNFHIYQKNYEILIVKKPVLSGINILCNMPHRLLKYGNKRSSDRKPKSE